jgi:hypothetical protein
MADEIPRVTTKEEAQRRTDQVRHFQAEVDALMAAGVGALGDEQVAAISAYHKGLLQELAGAFDIDASQRAKQLSLGMRIAAFLGALGLAASVFFLFYQFWGRFGTFAQVGILAAAPLLLLAGTWYAGRREASGYFARVLGMVCLASFVLNLLMLGQIFNIVPSDRAFLVWGALAFLLAYATDSRLLLAAGIILSACFLSARAGAWAGCYWIHFGQRPENFLLPAVLLFLVPVVVSHRRFPGFAVTYRVLAQLMLLLPVLILANWGAVSYLRLDADSVEIVYQIAGFLLSAACIWVGLRTGWGEVVNTGNVFFVIFLYTKFYDWWWEWLPKYLFFLLIGLSAILALLVFKRLRRAAGARSLEALP